jgi:hypothetical protein
MKIEMPKQKKFAMIPSLNLGIGKSNKLDFSKKESPHEEEISKPGLGMKINFSLNLKGLKNEPLKNFEMK